jgi:hypothetical protein
VDGAFTSGVLKGWSAAGNRPTFDVVTGISTGALIAPLAFLGPEYDDVLEHDYTTARSKDVYRERPWLSILWSDSIADSSPLKRRIDAEVTAEMIAKIAAAHARGRRLYVGTTNLDTKRPVVWDMGAIAAGDDPGKLELFRKVLLASCSVPAFLPPVPIEVVVNGRRHTELHVDGGVGAAVFLQPAMLGVESECDAGCAPLAAETNVYVVVAGKLVPDAKPVPRTLLRVAGESLDGVLQARLEGDLTRIFALSRCAGAKFNLAAVPDELSEDPNSLTFDRKAMRRLFSAGFRTGVRGGWLAAPPGVKPEDQPPPRAGVQFVVEEDIDG